VARNNRAAINTPSNCCICGKDFINHRSKPRKYCSSTCANSAPRVRKSGVYTKQREVTRLYEYIPPPRSVSNWDATWRFVGATRTQREKVKRTQLRAEIKELCRLPLFG
jgi:hypothetical protein